jgi:hypothetical protein
MKYGYLFGSLMLVGLLSISIFGQPAVVINDPLKDGKVTELSAADENLIKSNVLPKVQKHWATAIKDGICGFEFESMGVIKGAFSKPNSSQTLVFFEVCQTGNGFGNNVLALIENEKVSAIYVSEGGWAMSIKSLPDLNQNGLNEFALYYSGGMHQGQGGTGVDILELPASNIKGLGWFQADSFGEMRGDYSFKVSAKSGKLPIFYREKYLSTGENKWKKSGKITLFRLGKIACDFTVLR